MKKNYLALLLPKLDPSNSSIPLPFAEGAQGGCCVQIWVAPPPPLQDAVKIAACDAVMKEICQSL